MKKYKYINNFFINEDKTALKAASKIIPLLINNLKCRSVIDVGCGTAAWLYIFKKNGIREIFGLDSHKNLTSLRISQAEFLTHNLEEKIDLDKKYDLAISLEVAEHINPKESKRFVHDLCNLSNIILFSAATPGQGGQNHINENNLEYWRYLFRENDYFPYDVIRKNFAFIKSIAPWYRYNTLLYVNDEGKLKLSKLFLREIVSDNEGLKSYEPFLWKLRRFILRNLPKCIVNFLSKITIIPRINSILVNLFR